MQKKFCKNKTDFERTGCFTVQKRYCYREKALNKVFLDERTFSTLNRSPFDLGQILLPFIKNKILSRVLENVFK